MPLILIELFPYIATILVWYFKSRTAKANNQGGNGSDVESKKSSFSFTELLIVFVVAWYVKNNFLDNRKSDLESKIGTDKEISEANSLYQAFNPSGNDYLFGFDGTDTETVLSLASGIKDFEKVKTSYKGLFPDRNLVDDLRSELSRTDYTKFYAILGTGKTDSIPSKKVYEVYAKVNGVVRWIYKNDTDISGGYENDSTFSKDELIGEFVKNFQRKQDGTNKLVNWCEISWTKYFGLNTDIGFVGKDVVYLKVKS